MSTAVSAAVVSTASQDVDQLVTVLREQVLALCAQSSRPPSIVRMSARDVAVEVEWTHVVSPAEPAAVVPVVTEEGVAADATRTFPLCAGTVGTFYSAPEPGAKAFVTEGDTVVAGQQVGIIEAMKLMIPVESDLPGRVVEVLVDNGTSVEHSQPLMLLEPVS